MDTFPRCDAHLPAPDADTWWSTEAGPANDAPPAAPARQSQRATVPTMVGTNCRRHGWLRGRDAVEAERRAAGDGHAVRLAGATGEVRRLLALTGLDGASPPEQSGPAVRLVS
jgi:hypothetical protein